jgi:hypothetical protein
MTIELLLDDGPDESLVVVNGGKVA